MKSTVIKLCQSCKVSKSLSDFHRNKTKPDGHNGICKACQAKSDTKNKQK